MSFNHQTIGFDKYDAFVQALKAAGTPVLEFPADYLKGLGKPVIIRGPDRAHDCYCGYSDDKQSCDCCRGTCDHLVRLRKANFLNNHGQEMAVEEWLKIDDRDMDGTSIVDIAIYPLGSRPDLVTSVLESD